MATQAGTVPEAGARAEEGRSILPDPGAIWAMFRRRWLAFLIPALIVIGLAVLYLLTVTPDYRATANVIIEPRKLDLVTSSSSNAPVTSSAVPGTDEVDTEARILGSASIAGRVAQSLHLENYPEYKVSGSVTYDRSQPSTHPLAQVLLQHVTARRAGLTYVIDLTATSHDADLAARIANEFVRQYLLDREEAKAKTNRQAGNFLSSRLEKLREEAVAADANLQRYKIDHGLMSAEGATMAEQEVSQLNAEISRARADYAEKAGRLASARAQIGRGSNGAETQTALQSPTISDLRSKEAEASRRLADLTANYGDLYPEVVRTRNELADIRRQLQGELNRITASLQAEASIAASRLSSLEGSQGRARGSLASNNVAQISLLELQRRAEVSSAIYQAYLNRSKEVISREGLNESDAKISGLSRVPRLPYSPNIPLVALGALLAAIAAGFAGVAAAEYLDRGISTKQDVQRRLRVRYAGAVPELSSTLSGVRHGESPEDYLVSHPNSSFAEAFRSLRAILMMRGNPGSRVIAITSALPREGKSTTSICLGRTFAASDLRTVLVDCDIRRRSVGETLLAAGSDGLLRYLAGTVPIEQALVKDQSTDLYVLGTNMPPDASRDLFTEVNIRRLLDDLRQRFDVVLLDTAPVLALAESRDLAAAADAVLMVARWRKSSRRAVDAAIELLLASKAKLRGLALTRVDVRKFASTGGAEDVYGYHKKFAGYYIN